jgi:uracil-DNA glycosylase
MRKRLGTSLTDTVRDWRAIYQRDVKPRVVALPRPSWRNTGWRKGNPWFETDLLPFLRREIRGRIEVVPRNGIP